MASQTLKWLIGFLLFSTAIFGQTKTPHYFMLLQKEHPNVFEISDAFELYYRSHEYVKNDYTRAFHRFIRSYPKSSFDRNGNPLQPQKIKTNVTKQRRATVGGTWKAMPVKIDRTNCYYTGQNGVVRSLEVVPTNGNICFAGGAKGGLWKTENKGKTWSEDLLVDHPLVGTVNHIVVSPTNPNIVYVAANAGILKSTNQGASFEFTTLDYTDEFPSIDYGGDDYRNEYMFVDVSHQNAQKVVATNADPDDLVSRIAHSTDGGQTWRNYDFGYKKFAIDVQFHPTNDNIIYVLVEENKVIKFYRSTDFGVTYNQVTNGILTYNNPSNNEIRGRIALTPAQPDLVAFYLNVNDEGSAFYKSTNSGVSFTRACCGNGNSVDKSNSSRDFFGEDFSAVQIRWATTIAISDVDPNFIAAATNVQPRFSFDQMESWYWSGNQTNIAKRPLNVWNKDNSCSTEIHGDIQCMVIHGNDVWVANDGGIALSEDKGITFKEVADGIPVTMALGFDMTHGDHDVIVAALDHNGVIVKDMDVYGDYWKPLGGGDASGASINPIDNSWLYAIPSGSNIIKRPTSGPSHNHPNYLSTDLEFGSGYKDRFNNMEFHSNLYYTLYAVDYNDYTIKKSTDNGNSWTVIKNLMSASSWSYAEVKVSPSNPEVVVVSDYSNGNNTLDISRDGGNTWNSILPGNLSSNDDLRNVEFDNKDSDVLWLSINGSQAKVYKTTNGGNSWVNYSAGLPDLEVFSMVHQHGSNGGVYLGTRNGVYYRDNSFSDWQVFGTKLPGIGINFLKINYSKGILRAGTERGIWEIPLYNTGKPQAQISLDVNKTNCNGESIQFSATNSSVFNDGNRSYSWHFDGGIPAHSTAINPSVFYPLPGDYEVKLVVGNSAGKDSVTTSNLVHVNGSCQANEQFQLLSVNGTDKGPCRAEQQPSLVIYNRGIKDINSFQLTILKNEDIHLDESVATFIASGDSLVYPLDELDMEGVWKIEYIISSPNGNSDDETDNVIVSYISNESIEIQNISVVSFNSATSSNTPDNAVDGDENTYWHNQYWGAEEEFPYEMIFDLNGTYDLSSLDMLNRQNNSNGYLKGVDIYTSENGNIWKGPFSTDFAETSDWQTAYFGGMEGTRFVKLVVNSSISGAKVASIAEIKFSGCTSLITQVVGGSSVENLGIYPNPAQNYLQIKGFEEGMSYQLMNANGLLVEQGASAQLNIENLPKGTYFLTLKNKDVVWVKKWIKL